jgi:hypothetical protein
MEKLREMTKLERFISNYVIKSIDKSKLLEPDNFAMAMVEIIDSEYGRECNVTMLFKNSFNTDDSDYLFKINKSTKSELLKLFSGYFNTISISSQSTIESYLHYHQNYNHLRKEVDF